MNTVQWNPESNAKPSLLMTDWVIILFLIACLFILLFDELVYHNIKKTIGFVAYYSSICCSTGVGRAHGKERPRRECSGVLWDRRLVLLHSDRFLFLVPAYTLFSKLLWMGIYLAIIIFWGVVTIYGGWLKKVHLEIEISVRAPLFLWWKLSKEIILCF